MALMTFLLLWFPIHTRRFDKRPLAAVKSDADDAQ